MPLAGDRKRSLNTAVLNAARSRPPPAIKVLRLAILSSRTRGSRTAWTRRSRSVGTRTTTVHGR